MKKIAIATNHKDINSMLAERPGHCKYFCIADTSGKIEFIDNPGTTAGNAFGQIAFEALLKINPDMIIAGFFGPRFNKLASDNNIRLFTPPPDYQTINLIIENLLKK